MKFKTEDSNEFADLDPNCLLLTTGNPFPFKDRLKIYYEKNSSTIDFFEIKTSESKFPVDLRTSTTHSNSFYLACPEQLIIDNTSTKCKELSFKDKIPKKGGLQYFSKEEALSSSKKNLLFSLGFISNIKLSKTSITGYETLIGGANNYSLSLFYKKHNFPFEDDYLDEIQLKCGEIDYKLLENGFLMNNNIEFGFQIYYRKKNFTEFRGNSYYSNIYLEMKGEDDDRKHSFADFLLKNAKWNKLQCLNANEHMNIKLYYKQEFIETKIWEDPITPDVFLICSDNLNDILKSNGNLRGKNEILAFCPQYCSKTTNFILGNNIYAGKSSICGAAMEYGLINDLYSGYIKFSWYSLENEETFFIFEPLLGRTSSKIDRNLKVVKNNDVSSYFKSFLEISDRNRADLANIPTEVLSKISETMNQNSKEIIKQNHNIEELWKENTELNHKIEELENGDHGISNLSKIILNMEDSLMSLKQDLDILMTNQQNTHQIYQQKIMSFETKSKNMENLLRNSNTFIEDFSNVIKR